MLTIEERLKEASLKEIREPKLCIDCKRPKQSRPYPGAFNSKADMHQACDEAFVSKR